MDSTTIERFRNYGDAALAAGPALEFAMDWRLPVFPCGPNKRPLTKHGFQDATTCPVQIMRWWHRDPEALIGMPTGAASGIDVLDLDNKNGKNGFAKVPKWKKLSPVISLTVNKGAHLFFKSDGTVGSSSDQIAPGVDVRANGGYVILAPSPGYRWLNGHDFSKLPPFPADLKVRRPRTEEKPKPLPSNRPPVEADEIEAALAVIPADSYQTWFEIGCALHNELGDDGFKLFDKWSAKSKKYSGPECRKKWRECAKVSRYTVGTVFHHANQAKPDWRQTHDRKHRDDDQAGTITATPFAWIEPSKVPMRQWLYRPYYIRRFVTETVATGATGKTSLIIAEALAMVAGKALLDVAPERTLRVWYWNGEDPFDELQRRIAAACKHHKITARDLGNRLFVDSGRTMPIIIATQGKGGPQIAKPVTEAVTATLLQNKIDVLIVDPFVSCHQVVENDNVAIDVVAKAWAHIAEVANCSIMLVHHSRKTYGEGVSVEDSRGASALLAAVRAARALNTMTKEEAKAAGISDDAERRRLVRADNGKPSMTRPAAKSDWFKIESVSLGNSDFGAFGDDVGVIERWEYPEGLTTASVEALTKIWKVVKDGGPWRESAQSRAEPWIGRAVIEAMEISPEVEQLNRQFIDDCVKRGLRDGWLEQIDKIDSSRRARKYIVAADRPPH